MKGTIWLKRITKPRIEVGEDEIDEMIHDICVLDERIRFYNKYKPTLVDEISKLENRQRKVIVNKLNK